MTGPSITLVSEDALCQAIGERLLGHRFVVGNKLVAGGYGKLKRDIHKYNQIARVMPVLLITDLDRLACPALLIASWLPSENKAPGLLFRVAVHEAESWAMADRETFASFLTISEKLIPQEPDKLQDPKQVLLGLVRKSRNGLLKREMLPARGALSPEGLGYNEHLCAFIRQDWRIDRAAEHSPSLFRAVKRIEELAQSFSH